MSDHLCGLDFEPSDMARGPHDRCEVCTGWYPRGTVSFALGKERCPECRDNLFSNTQTNHANQLF